MKIKALAGEITEISFNANFACVYKTVFVHRCHLFNAVQRYFEQIFHRIKLFSANLSLALLVCTLKDSNTKPPVVSLVSQVLSFRFTSDFI